MNMPGGWSMPQSPDTTSSTKDNRDMIHALAARACLPLYRASTVCGLTLLACLAVPQGAQAQSLERPRWEFGLGLATAQLKQYRGSDETARYTTPFPYFVYRGDRVKADREGARAELLSLGDTHLDVGLGFAPPVSSERVKLREGMPDIPAIIDIGPALETTLYRSEEDHIHVKFRLPVGYGVKLGKQRGATGWQASPRLSMEVRNVLGQPGWNAMVMGGPVYATGKRHALYYDVAPAYATADRPAYRASGGYGGTQLSMTLNKRFDRYWVGAFLRHEWLDGAAYTPSPMVRTRDYSVVGLAVAWVFSQSDELVKVD
jgi:MipA family protein